jgi:hypothetical protein
LAKSVWMEFEGFASWARVYEADEYKGKKFWKINLHMKDEIFKKIKDLGWQGKRKTSDVDGVSDDYASFRCDTEKEFNGKKEKFLPPIIKDKTGKKLVWYEKDSTGYTEFGERVLIGNGSKVVLTLEVYQTKHYGTGFRLREVKIIDLIEYQPKEETEETQNTKGASLDDEIPFEKKVEEAPKPAGKKVSW